MADAAEQVMAPCGGRHRRAFQVTVILSGMFGLSRKVDFPAALELDLKELAAF